MPLNPPGDPGPLWTTANQLLTFMQVTFNTAIPNNVPAKQFVADGQAILDIDSRSTSDEFLIVEAGPMHSGHTGIPTLFPITTGTQFVLNLNVHILRSAPTPGNNGEMPTAAQITNSAQQVFYDRWLALHNIVLGIANRTIWTPEHATMATVDEVVAYGPEGGLVGSVIRLGVGYP